MAQFMETAHLLDTLQRHSSVNTCTRYLSNSTLCVLLKSTKERSNGGSLARLRLQS